MTTKVKDELLITGLILTYFNLLIISFGAHGLPWALVLLPFLIIAVDIVNPIIAILVILAAFAWKLI